VSPEHVVSTIAPAGGAKVTGIDSAVILNDRQIRLFTTLDQDAVLRGLADPAFALLDGLASDGPVAGGVWELPFHGGESVIQLRLPQLGDPRDALDRGADLIVTRDPALFEYAARRPEFTVHPLPWSRTYVLVQPALAAPLTGVSSGPERQSLARDAVHADARGAEPPFWWIERSCFSPETSTSAATTTTNRIVYPRGDEVARGLADRLVALAGHGEGLRAADLDQAQLAAALHDGSERAYVVWLPKHPLHSCTELVEFPAGAGIRPLIESRAHAIVRRGAPPLTVDWDGTIRVVRP
jgi:hypothetical protein